MTRSEIIKLLATLSANYPYAAKQIKNPAETADAWEMVLGCFEAGAVYKAARLHMDKSKFFPTPADIKEKILRADLIYNGPPLNGIEAPRTDAKRKVMEDDYLEELCKYFGFGYDEENDNANLTGGFMSWER